MVGLIVLPISSQKASTSVKCLTLTLLPRYLTKEEYIDQAPPLKRARAPCRGCVFAIVEMIDSETGCVFQQDSRVLSCDRYLAS